MAAGETLPSVVVEEARWEGVACRMAGAEGGQRRRARGRMEWITMHTMHTHILMTMLPLSLLRQLSLSVERRRWRRGRGQQQRCRRQRRQRRLR